MKELEDQQEKSAGHKPGCLEGSPSNESDPATSALDADLESGHVTPPQNSDPGLPPADDDHLRPGTNSKSTPSLELPEETSLVDEAQDTDTQDEQLGRPTSSPKKHSQAEHNGLNEESAQDTAVDGNPNPENLSSDEHRESVGEQQQTPMQENQITDDYP